MPSLGGAMRTAYPFAVAAKAVQNAGPVSVQCRNMATLKEIQIRLKSIRNIGKITKSMKMIASTKLTRAQKAMDQARVYGETSNAVFKFIEPKVESEAKPLLVAASSDRGLCGAIHSSISKPVKRTLAANPDSSLVVLGDKPKAQLQRDYRKNIVLSFNQIGKNIPTFAEAAAVTDNVLASKVDFGVANIYYNRFKSVIAYEMTILKGYSEKSIVASEKAPIYEIEEDVIQNFAEFTFANNVYHALAEGHASEMAARRTAMENATKNAGEMMDKLTMTYNRSRQATITSELVDIITGASAL